MVHSVVNNLGLSSVEPKNLKKIDSNFILFFSGGGSIPTLYLKSFNIFFLGPDSWKIYRSMGLTASMLHDGSSTHGDIFVESGSEKNVFKTVNSQLASSCSKLLNCPCGFLWWCSAGNEPPLKRRVNSVT